MTAYDEAISTAIESLSKLHECLASNRDVRKCFSLLPAIAFPFKGLVEISSDPDEMFIAYLIMDQLGNVQNVYDGRSDSWYEINQDNVQQLRIQLKNSRKNLLSP